MRHAVGLFGCLFVLWLLWSGHYTSGIITLGALSCLVVVLLARRMGIVDREGVPLHLALRLPGYLAWLAWEIVKANFDVARRILAPRLTIDPRVITLAASQETDLGRVIYANSITLTPGTVSIEAEGGVIRVHAIAGAAAEGLEEGSMDRRVTRLEGGA
ncbi:MAG: Na+/H+ antiporter subunit E [Planctomycetota bacterium]|nr:Na+/H+ antiporter subunit E [Planctomycetota bacterium]MDP6957068.1 Na+/H+ antiporter subunit E [Planctomycetota bacterium]